ncbi:MAG: Rv2231c family pyridoxal phosphate-dependent protein CobC [Corynebacterium sp.]|uniref:Rv2231c family pyridoxal phosphate-dependent protein CobC n=1 Tax=Corynebacterium sp. TaxID=1720 RepID=UPI0026DC7E1B|nr:Rv2231c family pyridoxal phosphate-dependent protein CobC [Corynebacterium sp.]MDO5029722.1 Rv2231c family pyridoxal phosphate-dependent protein CobC [Corynebacterium sp.]
MLNDPLRYHGDQAAFDADLDFAVNVRGRTPQWLQDELAAGLGELAAYPSAQFDAEVRRTIAASHGRSADEVLLLHGVAEGFSLLPHLELPAIIIQPQFTEPEAAFRAAGAQVDSLVLPSPYTLSALLDDVSSGAAEQLSRQLNGRVVVIGNPTNPTGVAHSAEHIRALASYCDVLVVDEAFMDVCDEATIQQCSVAGERLDNVIVFRSMTKTWAIAGLRCGYALGSPTLLERLARMRPHWPLGTLQLTAMAAITAREAELLPEIRREIRHQREAMTTLLQAAGWQVQPSAAPFVLARPPALQELQQDQRAGECDVVKHEQLRERLSERGVAVRRCDTFTGLDESWWRLAVRDGASVRSLIAETEAAAAADLMQ